MAYDVLSKGSLDYLPCRYGASKVMFRGPKRRLDSPYIAVLGGTETYGRFMEHPYPDLLEDKIGLTTVNFGCPNAGIDVFLHDEDLMDICQAAVTTVIQMPAAHNMSNRFYMVHPRRNDRFLQASSLLSAIYREVDFTEFHFTRHLLHALYDVSPDRFEMVRQELREAWVARMKTLISRIGGKVILAWCSRHSIGAQREYRFDQSDTYFVDAWMIDQIRPHVHEVVEVVVSADEVKEGREDLVVSEMDEAAAAHMLGSVAHERLAEQLHDALSYLY